MTDKVPPADNYPKIFRDLHPLLGKVYVHHYLGQAVLTTCFDPKLVGPTNIIARIGWRDTPAAAMTIEPSDAEKIIGDNLAYAANMERGQIRC